MSDLVSRLLAAIEEAEREAKHTEPGPWAVWPSDMPGEFVVARRNERTGGQDPDRVATTHGLYCAERNARFIAHNDPAAVLRRCASDRKMIALHARLGDKQDPADLTYPEAADTCVTCGPGDIYTAREYPDWFPYPCPTLLALAEGLGISVEEETT